MADATTRSEIPVGMSWRLLRIIVVVGCAIWAGCQDPETEQAGNSGNYRGPRDNTGFDYDYDYDADFYAAQTGTFISRDLAPVDEVGAWDAQPHTFSRTYHVRPPDETYGTGDGSSWTNALSGLPPALERDAKYFVAAGDYYDGPYDDDRFFQVEFEVPHDGERYVGIFKATGADHGSEDGWDEATLGHGQARFGPLSIVTGYLIIDGQVGNLGDRDSYGISFTNRDCSQRWAPVDFPWNCTATNVALRSLDVGHCGHRPDPTNGAETAIYSFAAGVSRLVVKNSSVRDAFRGLLFLQNSADILVEGNVFARAGLHHETAALAFRDSRDIVVRRNAIIDAYANYVSVQGSSNVAITGNVIRRTREQWDIWAAINITGAARDVSITNNTFFNLEGLNVGVRAEDAASGIQIINNLWAAARTNQIMLSGTHSHNAFYDNTRDGDDLSAALDEDTKQVLASDPFVDAPAGDLRLTRPTDAGQPLTGAASWDLNAAPRGADGTWDRGADEYEAP